MHIFAVYIYLGLVFSSAINAAYLQLRALDSIPRPLDILKSKIMKTMKNILKWLLKFCIFYLFSVFIWS